MTEDDVYSEMRALGSVFNVDAEALIAEMKEDFDSAGKMVAGSSAGKLTAVWLDCVGRCCKTDPGVEPQVFVGGVNLAYQMQTRKERKYGNGIPMV